MGKSTPRSTAKQAPAPAESTPVAREPGFHTVMAGCTSVPGRFDGMTLEEVIRQSRADALVMDEPVDIAVWKGAQVKAIVEWRPQTEEFNITRMDEINPPKRPHRHCNQIPMFAQTLRVSPPWSPDSTLTIQVILLPSGTGEGVDNNHNGEQLDRRGVPLTREDLHILAEDGWIEHEDTAVCAYVRFIR